MDMQQSVFQLDVYGLIVLEDLLVTGCWKKGVAGEPGRRSAKCPGSQTGMHDAVALDYAASGLFSCLVGVLLSEHWSCCMDNVLFESRIARTSLLCLVINCH